MKEVKRVAKVGEKIKIVNADCVPYTKESPDYKNGSVLNVLSVDKRGQIRYEPEINDRFLKKVVNLSEYVVLEGENEMRFKVGDKVKVIERKNMHRFKIGECVRIMKVTGTNYYAEPIKNWEGWWIEDDEIQPAPFTLSDLKPCMVVKYRNGELNIVSEYDDGLIIVGSGWMPLVKYTEEMLAASGIREFDIVEVYGFSSSAKRADEISTNTRKLLFKREEHKPKRKMTVAEICKELGQEIEIAKGE